MRLLPEGAAVANLAGRCGEGLEDFHSLVEQPFSPETLALLHALSTRLMAEKNIRQFPDVVSFAYWCRSGNLRQEAAKRDDGLLRIGRGMAFHVAPGNVPVNFAFSWAFGLLAGCANIVRLASREFPQTTLLLQHIAALLEEPRFASQAQRNVFIRYPAEQREITAGLCAQADARVIWGGDATVAHIRNFPARSRCVDIAFADRYSFSVLDAGHVAACSHEQLNALAENFYNDSYIMDQRACSSPHLVVWLGSAPVLEKAQSVFWPAVRHVVSRKYSLAPLLAMDKLVHLCCDALDLDEKITLSERDAALYRLNVRELWPGVESRRGSAGYFYEFCTDSLDAIAPIVTSKYQTMTYAGVSRPVLTDFIVKNALIGIDRIVPVGAALDMGLIWDGFDITHSLSRICLIQ